ncbi:DUF4276 family protein [Flexivirga caeni]|uniref:DUF4276 family protein n=1 Tax=Flexivirga caeni TaxID=2294115 RepID=A0A3M9MEN3_9MICO|nr:DUF4276 family protein [Flexivirga caeni]RNI23944.1 DUF4276 family protein [Flexivirga caeni]
MRQTVIVVEGQSEEAFVTQVLAPRAADAGVYLTPIVVKHLHGGAVVGRGGGSWKHYEKLLAPLIHQTHWDRVGLMCDFYGYPPAAPGADCPGATPHARREAIHASLRQAFPDPRFRPCVVLHEFETLVLAALRADRALFPQTPELDQLVTDLDGFDDLELVNDSVATSPSHRIATAWPEYQKAIDGIRILTRAPLSRVLSECATFHGWWAELVRTAP